MKFNLQYTNSFIYKDDEQVDYWILYNGHDEGVEDFLLLNKEKYITISFADEILNNMELYSNGNKLNDFILNEKEKTYKDFVQKGINNFTLQIPYLKESLDLAAYFRENRINFCFIDSVTSWEQLNYFIDCGVSDVLITGAFAFNIKKIYAKCHKSGVKIRVIPNIYQVGTYNDGSMGFFVRPEAIDKYAKYVDTFELRCKKEICNTVYEIFAINKEWYGDLDEIIQGCPFKVTNRNIVELFDAFRLNCEKRCVSGSRPCSMCQTTMNLSDSLTKQNIEYKRK